MATPYIQWRFPQVSTADGGTVELRINKGTGIGFKGGADATKIITLDGPYAPLSIGELDLVKHDPDGDVCVPKIDFVLNDFIKFGGTVNGSHVAWDLSSSNSSLLDDLFSDYTIIYEVWATYRNASVADTYFWGDIDPNTIPKAHKLIGGNEYVQEFQITANSAAERVKTKLVSDVLANIGVGDCQKQNINIGSTWPADVYGTVNFANPTALYALHYIWTNSSGLNGTFPHAVFTISLFTIFSKIATTAGFTAGQIDSNLMFDLYKQVWNTTTHVYDLSKLSVDWSQIMVSYNFLFGKSIPQDSSRPEPDNADWPCSIGQSTDLGTLIKWLAIQTGCFAEISIANSGSGVTLDAAPTMWLRGRRSNNGSLPASFTLISSSEEPRQVSKSSVVLNMKADNMKVLVGPNANDAVTIEIPWRCHKWGSHLTSWFSSDTTELWFDRGVLQPQQAYTVTCDNKDSSGYGGATTNPTDKGWVGGTYLLWQNPSSSPVWRTDIVTGSTIPANTDGGYAVAAILPAGTTLPSTDENLGGYWNPLWAYAQFYYQELVGNKIVLKRKYYGCRGNDGRVQSIKPGIRTTITIAGASRTFDAHEVKINVVEATCEITWVEVPASYTLANVQVLTDAGSTTSTGSSTSTQGSGSSTVTGAYVALAPNDTTQSTVAPKADIVGLTVNLQSGATKDIFDGQVNGSTLFKVDKSGNVVAVGGTFSDTVTIDTRSVHHKALDLIADSAAPYVFGVGSTPGAQNYLIIGNTGKIAIANGSPTDAQLFVNGTIGQNYQIMTPLLSPLTINPVTGLGLWYCDGSTGAISITLPDAVLMTGTVYKFYRANAGGGNTTILPAVGQTINGLGAKVLTAQYQVVSVRALQGNWIIE